MEGKNFISFKAFSYIDLKKAASFFGLPLTERNRDKCIILDEVPLTEIYKYNMKDKKVYLFSFGCVVFEDMEMDETDSFFSTMQSVIGEPDYKMMAKYRESHTLPLNETGAAYLWEGCEETYPITAELSYTIASILAKSTALSKQEADIDILLDEADSYVARFQRGVLNTGTRKFAAAMAHIIRFERESAAGIMIFDRPALVGRNLLLRDIYDRLSVYYEIEDRYEILEKKADELRNIVRSYSMLRYRRQENRLLVFETFLLLLFPLFRILEAVVGQNGIETFFQLIFSNLLQKFNIFF